MTQESFLPHSLCVRRHEPEVLESLDEQNQKLLAEVKTELHEINDELVRVSLCPMGASGQKKKSFGQRLGASARSPRFAACLDFSLDRTEPPNGDYRP